MASSIFRNSYSSGSSSDEESSNNNISDVAKPLLDPKQRTIGSHYNSEGNNARRNNNAAMDYRGGSIVYDNFGSKQRSQSSSFGLHPYVPLPSVFDDESDSDLYNQYIITNDPKRPIKAILLAIVYYVFSVCMPLFNDTVFRGYGKVEGYGYPLAATWIQMICVVVLLLIYNMLVHYWQRNDLLPKSWIFGKNFKYKMKQLLFPSLAFAAVMAFTNLGLYLIDDVNIHVLLRCSEIIWVVLFAFLIQREVPSLWTLLCCLALIVGTIFLSLDFSQDSKDHKNKLDKKEIAVAIVINLLSSVATGLMIVLLRRACVKLREKDPTISILEITLIKVAIATVFLAIPTLSMETGAWKALGELEGHIEMLVWLGVLVTMIYQSVTVGLASYALATTVGILAQSKIIPQIVLTVLLEEKWDLTALHITGTILVVIGSIVYAVIRFRVHKQEEKEDKPEGRVYQVEQRSI